VGGSWLNSEWKKSTLFRVCSELRKSGKVEKWKSGKKLKGGGHGKKTKSENRLFLVIFWTIAQNALGHVK
jgi:hypothetical protein